MDDPLDPLEIPTTPLSKRRRLMAVHAPSPTQYPDLLAAFRVKQSPTSITKMERQSREKKPFSYAESEDSITPQSSRHSSNFSSPEITQHLKDEDEDASEDELLSDNDVIHVVVPPARVPPARSLPSRSTRNQVSYAKPELKKRKVKTHTKNKRLLKSDTVANDMKPTRDTARSRVRQDIADHTKPKRDAFLLANKEYFSPLLPETNYIEKLARLNKGSEWTTTAYVRITEQPAGIKATMKPYQLEGLSFLVHMYKNGMSAVLGDEMGLGKTLQTLSLFAHLDQHYPTTGESRPYIVVCPLSVLSSWYAEAKKWFPSFNVLRFHGPKAERDRIKQEAAGKIDRFGSATGRSNRPGRGSIKDDHKPFDLVITSYETFVSEQGWFKRAFVWRYCVLDEGHKIKNDKSNVSSALQSLNAEHRLLLTGTPLQNNLHEMWALLHWLYPDVFTLNTADKFKEAFDLTRGKVSTSFMDDARQLLELIMLRRMKNSPGVNLGLPPKEEILLYVPLTPMQRFWYERLLTRAGNSLLDDLFKDVKGKEMQALKDDEQQVEQLAMLEKANDLLEAEQAGGVDVWAESKTILQQAVHGESQDESKSTDWRKLMNLMIQLRKACNHPYVLPNAAPDPYYLGDHVRTASGKFIVLEKLVEELVMRQKKKVLIFSGWTKTLDLCEDLLQLQGGNTHDARFRYLRLDGSTARARRNLGIRMFNEPTSEFRIMLISTRAGGLGINLASASDVVFMDEDWNPQITLQAEARAHRIGQNQKVTIYKLCTQGTVEEQMMGRIRKKLYLSAKITESMRNIHTTAESKKRKRGPSSNSIDEDDAPQLGTSELKSLIRRGAQTLSRPQVDVTEMLSWDWQTTLEKCKDKADDAHVAEQGDKGGGEVDEQSWLNAMEKVECAVFEGKKHQRELDAEAKQADLTRSDRRIGKHTTVMVDGFAISKESMTCGDWEAVPTMAGKDPRLAEPVRAKKAKVEHQSHCQVCWDGGEMYMCSSCPRSYHYKCLTPDMKGKAKGKMNFFCPQHECVDCEKKTAEAGGMIYRCRWCEKGYCEDCLDWENVNLIGETLPEYEMVGYSVNNNAWFVDCPTCVLHWKEDKNDRQRCLQEKRRIDKEYSCLSRQQDKEDTTTHAQEERTAPASASSAEAKPAKRRKVDKITTPKFVDLTGDTTPDTISEVATPMDIEPIAASMSKKAKQTFFSSFRNGLKKAMG